MCHLFVVCVCQLFQCRDKAMGKPAPEDWSRSKRGPSFSGSQRVTVCDLPAITAENNVKKYLRIPLAADNRAATAPSRSAVIIPTYNFYDKEEEEEVMMPVCTPAPTVFSARAATAAALQKQLSRRTIRTKTSAGAGRGDGSSTCSSTSISVCSSSQPSIGGMVDREAVGAAFSMASYHHHVVSKG